MKKTPSDLSTSGQLKTLERGNEEAESSLLEWTELKKKKMKERKEVVQAHLLSFRMPKKSHMFMLLLSTAIGITG